MMRPLRVLLCAGLLALIPLAAAPSATAGGYDPLGSVTPQRVHGTIVDVAVSNPAFSTLVTALTAANLVTTLQGPGPYTVFAPTNDAFAKIPAPVLNYLLANADQLKSVLLYHVAAGRKDLAARFFPVPLKTVNGQVVFPRLRWIGDKPTIEINNSKVILRPIAADNGNIYVIDSVLLPQYR